MSSAPSAPLASPLAIVVGVTGHRDLRPEDVERLEGVFRAALVELRRRCPHSSIVVLSALAEGADRLAAKVALDTGARLVAALPLPRALYEDDFETPDVREEFADLLARAHGVIDLPLLPGVTDDDVRQHGPARDREYAKVGAYIARHSQVFFAFWDGTPERPDTVGGTAQAVTFRLRGVPAPFGPPPRTLVLDTRLGPVVHVETPRRSNPASASLTCATRILHPDDRVADAVERICARMDEFNADAAERSADLRARDGVSAGQLLGIEPAALAAALAPLPPACQPIAQQYATADGLALHFGEHTRSTWKRVVVCVMAAAALLHLHAASFVLPHGTPASSVAALATLPWLLMAFVALSTFTATWIYGRAEKREYQTKYQDYRAIAEALRIQFFWRIAGIEEPVVEHYLRKQHSELEWIRSALKSCDVMAAATPIVASAPAAPQADRLRLVMTWVEDQRHYFARKARSEDERHKQELRTVGRLLKASGALAIVLVLVLALPFLSTVLPVPGLAGTSLGHVPYEVFMVVMPLLAVGAGLIDGYGRLLARAEHVRQFTRMSELFSAGQRELDRLLTSGDRAGALTLIRDLGMEALDENGDWLVLHRDRPLEVPPG